MKFSIYQESRIGGRKSNQDRVAYCYSRDALLMVVADGMGGHLYGEIAAQVTAQFMAEAFQRAANPSLPDPAQFLVNTITDAHHAIVDYARVRALTETPRTTCVAAIVQDGVASWAHVGDSRLYHLREGQVTGRTKDHSRVQLLVDLGRLREEAIAAHPDRNKIFNCLGQSTPPKIDVTGHQVLRHGDTLLLCTDGFWGPLGSRTIAESLHDNDILQGVPRLIDLAESRAGRESDNISVVAMTWAEEFSDAHGRWISTVAMGAREHTAQMSTSARTAAPESAAGGFLSDDEIEQAIEEIRNAIRKHSV